MKATFFLLLCLVPSILAAPTPPTEPPLFLHFFAPYYDTRWSRTTSPERIVSVQVHPSQEFDVAVGSSTLSILHGRIDPHGHDLSVHLQGRYKTVVATFDGDIELEKPVRVRDYTSVGGATFIVGFVVSTNPDFESFLKQQAARDEQIASPFPPK